MRSHDEYGKAVLKKATDGLCEYYGACVEVDYGSRFPARIDGAVGGTIAVEVESRTSKQVRGAVLDLLCHPYPKKLLLLLPVHMSNPAEAATQCRVAMGRFLKPEDFIVLLLKGHGGDPHIDEDAKVVRLALEKLSATVAA